MLKKRINYEPESVEELPLYCGHGQKWLGLFLGGQTSGFVKDYSMPAIEQGLAAWTDVQGRRWIILRGGNRGVEAAAVELS